MKTSLLFLIFLSPGVFAQTKISGKVTDTKGNPIPMANVSLVGTYDGASTDDAGVFEFVSSETGRKILAVTFTGFKESRLEIPMNNQLLTFSIQLSEDMRSLDAITITAGSFTAGDQSRRTILRALDIATTAGATADIAGALNTLPGTQKAGESGRLFVRGGDGDETRTFIDGQLVLDAYGVSAPNTPSRGRFLPFMFKGTSFSTGGYSAEYGQALSSALVLDSKDKSEITRTDLGILSVGADVGHTHVWDRGSLAGKIQYTNLAPYFGLIQQQIDWVTPPRSIEGHGAFRVQSGEQGLLKIYGHFNNTRFSLNNHGIDNYNQTERYDLTNHFRYINASYKNVLNEDWMVRGGFSFTNQLNDETAASHDVRSIRNGVHGKAVVEGSLSGQMEIKTGLELLGRTYARRESARSEKFDEFITAVFAEADLYAGKDFISRGGVRVEYDDLNHQLSVDPRLSLAYRTGPVGQISFAYGKFRQAPGMEWLRKNTGLKSERADHYILNYQRIQDGRTFRIESYYKRYHDLVKFTDGNKDDLNNSGYGFAKGVELFWRDNKSLKDIDYWVSYSLLTTKRKYLHFPVETTPSFASAHNFSLVYKHFIHPVKSQMGFTWSYTSGRPFHDPNQQIFHASRTPAYVDLSLNWSYLPTPAVIVYLSCTNLLGRENIFGYEYSGQLNESGTYNSRPIGQSAKRFLFAGIFITLSKERSVNQLPNL